MKLARLCCGGLILFSGCAELQPKARRAASPGDWVGATNLLAVYNKAQEAQTAGDHAAALKGFLTVRQNCPTDWRTRTKVIQEYAAAGKTKERDAEIAALYAFRLTLPPEIQSNKTDFCREQFTANKRKVMVYEYFELQGERALKYAFHVLKRNGMETDFKISLGSYETTTEAARSSGDLGAHERLFHLDGYFADEHRTYTFFKGEPDYDLVRQMFIEILEGKRRHISRSYSTTNGRAVESNAK